MARGLPQTEHLLRRAGFGASADEMKQFDSVSLSAALDYLIEFDRVADDVDAKIGQAAYAGITTRGQFSPNTNIEDARQRWLFRMVHSGRPLQEKMTLFWHNHFATAYSKVAGYAGQVIGTKMMALKPGDLPGPPGQMELLRQHALGSFQYLLKAAERVLAQQFHLSWRTGQIAGLERHHLGADDLTGIPRHLAVGGGEVVVPEQRHLLLQRPAGVHHPEQPALPGI